MTGSPSFTTSQSLLKYWSTESVMLSNHLILCAPFSFCLYSFSSSVVPFSSCLQSFPASGLFKWVSFFASGGQSIGASASASVLMNIQGWSLLDWLVWSSCSSRDSRESFPAPQFKSNSSLVFSLLYGWIPTTIYDYWKNHSLDYTDLCQQSDVCAFLICCSLGLS